MPRRRYDWEIEEEERAAAAAAPPPDCWLCRRPLGTAVQWHHAVPKSRRGRTTVPVHPICHRTIHANFTNAELERQGGTREALLERDEMRRFLAWIADKPPDFSAPTRGGSASEREGPRRADKRRDRGR